MVVRYSLTPGLASRIASTCFAASLVTLSRVPIGSSWSTSRVVLSANDSMKSVFSRVADAMVPAKISTAEIRMITGRRSAKPRMGR